MVTWDADNVRHLLNRAGFGASQKDVTKYLNYGQALAVEKLVTVSPSFAKGPGGADDDSDDFHKLQVWWAKRMAKASSRRLQEKMTLFWHDHFATAFSVTKNNLRMSLQNQTFRAYGLGSFHTLVHRITKDAAMLDFLDGDRNQVGKPNENYGREVMELFTLGVTDLSGADNYAQTDVTEIARCLTGFVIQNDVGVFQLSRFDGGTKTLFAGTPYQATGNIGVEDSAGVLLPPARNVIDILFSHQDSDTKRTMPRFLAKKLWEYFAYPSPAKTLLDELTVPFITNPTPWVISDLLRAIFTHDEFYTTAAKTSSVKNPCEYAFSAYRALLGKTNGSTLPDLLENMGMSLFDPPTVNGWNGGLAWVSSGQFLARVNYAQTLAAGRDSILKITPTKLFPVTATTAAEVVDAILDRLGLTNRVPADVEQALVDYFGGATNFVDLTVIEQKVRGAVYLMLTLPESNIH